MFCLTCLYVLDSLSADRCPECGRRFDRSDPRTFGRWGSWRYWVRKSGRALVRGVIAGVLIAIISVVLQMTGYGPWSLAALVILVNAPSVLLASEMPDSLASIIVGIGPIVCYPAYVIAVVSFRKWFIRGFVLVCILALHLWAFRQVMEKIMSALGTILSSQ